MPRIPSLSSNHYPRRQRLEQHPETWSELHHKIGVAHKCAPGVTRDGMASQTYNANTGTECPKSRNATNCAHFLYIKIVALQHQKPLPRMGFCSYGVRMLATIEENRKGIRGSWRQGGHHRWRLPLCPQKLNAANIRGYLRRPNFCMYGINWFRTVKTPAGSFGWN